MSNVNTVQDAIILQGRANPVTLAFTTAGHVPFGGSASPLVLSIPNPAVLAISGDTFPGRALDGVPFLISAGGKMTLGRGVEYQIDVNQGTGLTPSIASTGAQTSPLGAGLYNDNWYLECECMWDSASLNLRGIYYGWAGSTQIAQAPLVTSAPANLAALQFNVAVTVVNANPANVFTLTEFAVEI
jgi:hypothetical protein